MYLSINLYIYIYLSIYLSAYLSTYLSIADLSVRVKAPPATFWTLLTEKLIILHLYLE